MRPMTSAPELNKPKQVLKPCPFCGEKVELHKGKNIRLPFLFYVHHIDESKYCFIAPDLTITAMTEAEAIKAWNRRAK